MNRTRLIVAASLSATALGIASPAHAGNDPAVTLNRCEQSYGTIAVVDGDTQGWTKYGLGSPRDLIAALAVESGCFTPHDGASGQPATFLMNVIAGDKEEVDRGIELARGAAVEGLVRSGAASGLVRGVPGGGAVLGMLGGLGGRRKTIAAGIRLIRPANGQTIVSGTGDVTRTSISLGGIGGVAQGAQASGYAGKKEGQMLVEAFIKAFNAVSAQGAALASVPAAAPAAADQVATAVDTRMLSAPATDSSALRSLRAGTSLTRTGNRQGLFVEVTDSVGTRGWVSVEDLR